MSRSSIRLAYADTALGQLHYAEAGAGTPVLLLHQTPRSWDEFREVLPLLGRGRRAIAMDMFGFGLSAKPAPGSPQTIEMYAAGAVALADALELDELVVAGHHTGAFVATELAAAVPDRVRAVVLSGGEYADAAFRAGYGADGQGTAPDDPAVGVDVAPIQEDGSHLLTLWRKREGLYPVGRPDVLNRFIRDALAPGVDPAEGHQACARYRMEDRVGLVTAPVLLIGNTADPVSYPQLDRLSQAFPNAASVDVARIQGGTVAVMEQEPDAVAAAIQAFLDDQGI